MTFQTLSRLRSPSESVPLGESLVYQEALRLVEGGAFQKADVMISKTTPALLRFTWDDPNAGELVVQIAENLRQGSLRFSCSNCLVGGRSASSCSHQWASVVLLWQALTEEREVLQHPDVIHLSTELDQIRPQPKKSRDVPAEAPEFAKVELESVSLFLDEVPLFKGPGLASFLNLDLGKYQPEAASRQQEFYSPRLWQLPEVFRRRLTAASENQHHDVNLQNRMLEIVRYNFSNGMQLGIRELLKHPLHRQVPLELLPQAQSSASIFARWPLSVQSSRHFLSHSVAEVEEILQSLLARMTDLHRQKKLKLYVQNKANSDQALELTSVEFDPTQEMDWRVDVLEGKTLRAQFKLVSFRNQPLVYFPSFALDAGSGVLIVHPWTRELSLLQESLSAWDEGLILTQQNGFQFEVEGEAAIKAVLRILRSRSLPVKLTGESRTVRADQSQTEIRLNEMGEFYVQHEARVSGQKNMVRAGWSSRTQLFLQVLSEGLPVLLHAEARDIASRSAAKRDWDLKLLKHLGIMQFLMMEILSVHFHGETTEGETVSAEDLFPLLQDRIRNLLIAGSNGVFVRDLPLTELCSKSVLTCFEDFIQTVSQSMKAQEAFYSEGGEVIMEGLIEREMRLLFEMLKSMAARTRGEAFRRSRTSFLTKITATPSEGISGKTPFYFPMEGTGSTSKLMDALEALQALVPHGYRIYYKDQILQELKDDEFHVDFVLFNENDPKMLNWFELNPKFFLMGEEVDADQFLNLGSGGVIEYQGRLYMVPPKQLPSLKRLEKFWEKLQKGKIEGAKKKFSDKVYHLPRHQTLELLALRASGIKIQGDAEWQSLCEFYDSMGNRDREPVLPAAIREVLKPYQASGVRWLQDLDRLRLGALLADDMGLGKTLQTLAFLESLRGQDDLGNVLIIVPSSLIFNWQSEVQKFTPKIPLVVFSNKDREQVARQLESPKPCVVIATYGLLIEHEDLFTQYKWRALIFDEAQNLKNITTKRTSSARALEARFKMCLTGTPMENHYGEFFSLVDLLVPGSLGKLDEFRRRFVNTEMITREEIDDLKLKIRPLLLRRTKKEILDQLPDKQETKVSIAFEEKQKEIYRDIAMSYNQRVQETMGVQGAAQAQLQMLTALLRLRQACSDPAALPNVRYNKVPPKLETLIDSVSEIVESGESALVFTQFLQTLEHTEQLLKNAGIPVFTLHGGVPTKQRQKALAEFHALQGGGVMLMTLKTGGVGLNLTKASYVFHLEPWWNPSVENQATDRAHRLGQSKAVQVFRYIMHESLEEKIELLKDRKDRKFQALFTLAEGVGDLEKGTAALSKEDFDLLLGLR